MRLAGTTPLITIYFEVREAVTKSIQLLIININTQNVLTRLIAAQLTAETKPSNALLNFIYSTCSPKFFCFNNIDSRIA